VCVCVCVCVRERERERERDCVLRPISEVPKTAQISQTQQTNEESNTQRRTQRPWANKCGAQNGVDDRDNHQQEERVTHG
jgi:hypothetical protein